MANWLNEYSTERINVNTWSQPVFLTETEMGSMAEKSATWDLSSSIRGEITDWIRGAIAYPLVLDNLISLGVIYSEEQELAVGSPSVVSGIIGPTGVNVRFTRQDVGLYNLGKYTINRTYNDYRDYEPYSSYECYLPFYGYISVKAADVLGYTLGFYLKIDWKSGLGLYYVTVEKNDEQRIIGTYQVTLGVQIPLGQSGALEAGRNVAMGVVRGAAAVASMYVTGSPVGVALAGGSNTTSVVTQKGINEATGRLRKTSEQAITSSRNYRPSNIGNVNKVFDSAASVLGNFQFHPNVDRANNAVLDAQTPREVHIVIRRAKFVPQTDEFLSLYGKPLGDTRELSDLTGYTKIDEVFLTDEEFSTATSEELNMIKQILNSGVILPPASAYQIKFYVKSTNQLKHPLDLSLTAKRKSTWASFISTFEQSSFGVTFSVADGAIIVKNDTGEFTLRYGGVDVKPDDFIIADAEYNAKFVVTGAVFIPIAAGSDSLSTTEYVIPDAEINGKTFTELSNTTHQPDNASFGFFIYKSDYVYLTYRRTPGSEINMINIMPLNGVTGDSTPQVGQTYAPKITLNFNVEV